MTTQIRPNIRRLRAIVRWLRSPRSAQEHRRVVFDMRTFGREISNGHCKTAACIGGSALLFYGPKEGITYRNNGEECSFSWRKNGRMIGGSIHPVAGSLLGLNERAAIALFCPDIPLSEISPTWAARTVERLIATGEVNWLKTARGDQKLLAQDATVIANWGQ